MEDIQQAALYLARNIAKLRQKKSFSQQQLAQLAGIPRSTLTHIESGSGNPSLNNLVKISSSLGVSVEELLSRPRADCAHIPAAQVPIHSRSQGKVLMHKILPDKIKGIEIDRLEFSPESQMGGQPHLVGTKEYLSVLKGEILVYVAGDSFAVKKGDVLAFAGNQMHSYRNPLKTASVAISVVIPIPAHVF